MHLTSGISGGRGRRPKSKARQDSCLRGQVFEVDVSRGPPEGFALQVEPPRASELSRRICALLADLRAGRPNYAACFVVRQGEPPLVSAPSLLPPWNACQSVHVSISLFALLAVLCRPSQLSRSGPSHAPTVGQQIPVLMGWNGELCGLTLPYSAQECLHMALVSSQFPFVLGASNIYLAKSLFEMCVSICRHPARGACAALVC